MGMGVSKCVLDIPGGLSRDFVVVIDLTVFQCYQLPSSPRSGDLCVCMRACVCVCVHTCIYLQLYHIIIIVYCNYGNIIIGIFTSHAIQQYLARTILLRYFHWKPYVYREGVECTCMLQK